MNADEHTTDTGTSTAAPQRRLVRYPDAGPGAGVAAGLGAYFGLDPVLFRIGFVLLSFAGGTGILLYLVGWALIPEVPGDVPAGGAPAAAPDDASRWAGVALVVIAALWLTSRLDIVSPPVAWAVALVALGVLLFRGDLSSLGGREAGAGAYRAVPPPQPSLPPPPPAPAPAPVQGQAPPPRSPLGRLTAGTAMLVGGAVALLDAAGVLDVGFRHYAALVLLVVGIGLLIGAWWGRARGLVAAGLLLLPVVLFASIAGAFWDMRGGGVGEQYHRPAEATEVADAYELLAGELHVDLSGVDLAGATRDVRAGVTFGELVVVVPGDAAVEIDAAVGAGEIRLPADAQGDGSAFDRPAGGLRIERQARLEGGDGTLVLDLSSGLGTVTVRRAQ